MILSTKEDFEKAILNGEEIKYSTVFYTEKLEQTKPLEIGDYNPKLGIFAGFLHGNQVWVDMKDEPEEMTWNEAMKWAKDKKKHIPTIKELTVACLHKEEINKALEENGGEPFLGGYYWSSSECSNHGAWRLDMDSCYQYANLKHNYYFVRCFQVVQIFYPFNFSEKDNDNR